MVLCKICGTVYDEYFGVCPKCGTPCQPDTDSEALPPLGKPAPEPSDASAGALPPIDIAIQNSGDTAGIPAAAGPDATIPVQKPFDPDATIPVQKPLDPDATIPVQKPFDPDATIPVQKPLDPDATIPVQKPFDPDATIPVQKPFDPDATIPVQKPFDPDATIPVQKPLDPDATIPVQKPFDPDATIPVQKPFDPDATIPVQKPLDPDATIPVQKPFDPDATVPVGAVLPRTPIPQDNTGISQTQEIPITGNQQYGDNFTDASEQPAPVQPKPKKKSSAGKIIAIILIIAVVLGGIGTAVYFIFFNKPQTQASQTVTDGDKYLAEGNYDKAIEAFLKAVEEDPQNADLYMKLADAYSGSGNHTEAVKALQNGYSKTSDAKLKDKLDKLEASVSPDALDPDTLRSDASSMNMAILNLYVGVTNGSVSADSPSDQLHGLNPSQLPSANAVSSEKEKAANALTMQDVITYAGLSDKINSAVLSQLVYEGAQVYYKGDHSGTPLTADTTIGTYRGVHEDPQSSEPSQPESSAEESSQISEPSGEDLSANASALNSACMDLYTLVEAGIISQKNPEGIDTAKLPAENAAVSQRKTAANALTIRDAVAYKHLDNVINDATIGSYVYNTDGIFAKGSVSGIVLTMDTRLGNILSSAQTSDPEPSESSEPSQSESSVEQSSQTESSTEVSTVSEPVPDKAVLAGTWLMTFNSAKYQPEEIEKFKAAQGYDKFVILLNADGTASAYNETEGEKDIIGTGTWSLSNNTVSVTLDGSTEVFTYTNGYLYNELLEDIAYFVKQ